MSLKAISNWVAGFINDDTRINWFVLVALGLTNLSLILTQGQLSQRVRVLERMVLAGPATTATNLTLFPAPQSELPANSEPSLSHLKSEPSSATDISFPQSKGKP